MLRALFFLATAPLFAQDDAARRIDDLFQRWNKIDTPGVSVAVVRDGEIVLQRGYGAANLEYDIAVKPETVFHVASVSKQFTAMALVLLEQDGKLSLEDDIHKYLTELPDYGRRVTIRNLLQHTSGIRDQWQTLALAGWRLDDVITQQQILRMLFHQRELNFDPGARHLYSNGGYTLAAEIVARVSGKALPEFCDERIFKPLGMTRTHFHIDHQRIVRDRAYSYEGAPGAYRASPLNYANVGATSLFTTAPDLCRWLDNFRDPKVGGAKAVARLQEQAVLSDGEKVPYALGLSLGKYRSLNTISHGGADAGYRSYVVWFPGERLGVAVLSGLGSFNSSIANQVAAVYLESKMTADTAAKLAARTYITLTPEAMKPYEGHYRVADLLMRVTVQDGKLMAAPVGSTLREIKPVAPNRFYAEGNQAEVEFTPKDGGGMTFKLTQGGGTVSGDRVAFTAFDDKDLPSYVGSYWSDELETQYTVHLKDGKLVLDHVRHGEIALTPLAKDHLRASTWFMQDIRFTRDASGKVTGMIPGGGRVTGIKFVRR